MAIIPFFQKTEFVFRFSHILYIHRRKKSITTGEKPWLSPNEIQKVFYLRFIFRRSRVILIPNRMKGGKRHEHQCQQVYWMHRKVLRIPLRYWELLLPGPYSGGHPWGKPCHGSVHRLQVLPQKVIWLRQQMLPQFFLDAAVKKRYDREDYGEKPWKMFIIAFMIVHTLFTDRGYTILIQNGEDILWTRWNIHRKCRQRNR